MTGKRSSETPAEKLPIKKSRDSPEMTATYASSTEASPMGNSDMSRSTTPATAFGPSLGTHMEEMEPTNESMATTPDRIPKPPRSESVPVSHLAYEVKDTESTTATTLHAPDSTGSKTSAVLAPKLSYTTTPHAATTSHATANPPKTRKLNPWHCVKFLGMTFLILFCSALTFGLWMQNGLKAHLESLHISHLAREEAHAQYKSQMESFQVTLEEKDQTVFELREQLVNIRKEIETEIQKSEMMKIELKQQKDEKKNCQREAIRSRTERNELVARLEMVQSDHDIWRERAESGGDEYLLKRVQELEERLAELQAHSAEMAKAENEASVEAQALLEEMNRSNGLVQKLEQEGKELRDEVARLVEEKQNMQEQCAQYKQ